MFVQVAEPDLLKDEGLAFRHALVEDEFTVSLDIYPKMPHGFTAYSTIPAYAVALQRAARAVCQMGNMVK
jgi:acetyl esterase/lipase